MPSRRSPGQPGEHALSFRTRHESAEVEGSTPSRWRMVVVEATEPTYLTRDRSVAQRLARVRHAVSFPPLSIPSVRWRRLLVET